MATQAAAVASGRTKIAMLACASKGTSNFQSPSADSFLEEVGNLDISSGALQQKSAALIIMGRPAAFFTRTN